MLYQPSPLPYIRVWADSRVFIRRFERTEARVREDQPDRVEFDLEAGHIFCTYQGMPRGSAFVVHGPTFLVRSAGATFDVDVDGVVKVLDASLLVIGQGFTQKVSGQQMFDVRTQVLSPLPTPSPTFSKF